MATYYMAVYVAVLALMLALIEPFPVSGHDSV